MKKFIKIGLTILVSIVFSLCLAEIFLRLKPGLVLESKPIVYEQNKEGFRDINHEINALPGILRIAFIGDSYTRGEGVGINQTIADLTPRILSKKINSRIEGFNFGMSGANILRNLSTLKDKVWKYNPDIVVLAFVPNDFSSDIATSKFIKYSQKEKEKFRFFKSLENFSYLASLLDNVAFQLLSNSRKAHLQWLNESFSPELNPAFPEMITALTELLSLISQKDGVVLYFPYFLAANERQLYYYKRGLSLLNKECERKHCVFIEVAELLKDKNYSSWWVSKDNHHPNAAAHAKVAEKLSKILSARISESRNNDLNHRP